MSLLVRQWVTGNSIPLGQADVVMAVDGDEVLVLNIARRGQAHDGAYR